jgi:hypothetical protein
MRYYMANWIRLLIIILLRRIFSLYGLFSAVCLPICICIAVLEGSGVNAITLFCALFCFYFYKLRGEKTHEKTTCCLVYVGITTDAGVSKPLLGG